MNENQNLKKEEIEKSEIFKNFLKESENQKLNKIELVKLNEKLLKKKTKIKNLKENKNELKNLIEQQNKGSEQEKETMKIQIGNIKELMEIQEKENKFLKQSYEELSKLEKESDLEKQNLKAELRVFNENLLIKSKENEEFVEKFNQFLLEKNQNEEIIKKLKRDLNYYNSIDKVFKNEREEEVNDLMNKYKQITIEKSQLLKEIQNLESEKKCFLNQANKLGKVKNDFDRLKIENIICKEKRDKYLLKINQMDNFCKFVLNECKCKKSQNLRNLMQNFDEKKNESFANSEDN